MMREMNRALKETAKYQAKITESLANQSEMYRSIQEILLAIQTETLPEINDQLEDMDDTMGGIGGQTGILTGVLGGLGKAFSFVFGIIGKLGSAAWGILKGIGSTLIGIGKFVGGVLVGVFKTAFNIVGGVVGGFLKVWVWPLQKAFEIIWSTIKSVTGEFKLMGGIIPDLGKIAGELAQEARALAEAMETVRGALGNISKGSDDMGAKVSKAMKTVGGSFGRYGPKAVVLAQEMQTIFTDLGETAFGRLGNEIANNAKVMWRFVKSSGIGGETLKQLGRYALFSGRSLKSIVQSAGSAMKSITKLTGGAASFRKQFAEARGDIRMFGNVSDKVLTASIAHVNSLGLSLRDMKGMMTSFDDFPKAAENVSMLNQQLGMNLNVLDLVQEQDPAKRFDMVRKEFLAQGKSFESMTRQQKDLLSRTLDTPVEILAAGFRKGGASLDDLTKKVKKEQPLVKMTRVLGRLAKAIERLFVIPAPSGGLFGAFFQGIEHSVKYSGYMGEFSKAMLKMQNAGRRFGAAMMATDSVFRKFVDFLVHIFTRGEFVQAIEMAMKAFHEFVNNPSRGIRGLLEDLWKAFEHFLGKSGAKRIADFLAGIGRWWMSIGAEMVRFMVEGARDALIFLTKSYN